VNLSNKKILVVEDEFITAADLIENLELMGFIVPASTGVGEEVYDLARTHSPDLILMDINLKGKMTGIMVADLVRKKLDIPVVFLTGQSDEATIEKAIEVEPFGYIIKPFEERSLKTTIAMALYKHSIDSKLIISEERYRRIAESSDNLIAILNFDGTFDYINPAGASLLDLEPGMITREYISKTLVSPILDDIEQYIQSPQTSSDKRSDRMKICVKNQEIWIYSTITPLLENKKDPRQFLWVAKDITEWVELQQKMQKEGLIQIEKNMEQFQILNDQIRNPLTLIASYASMDECPYSTKITEAVNTIDNLVTQLDKGWIESEKVRSFLLRHYRHGEKF
jgi:two-component system, response regulator PdtaR